ncbi:MAG: hypothetical protein ACRETW_11735 [Stenotrophobium sp.]
MTWPAVFDPCSNLQQTQRHLLLGYRAALAHGDTPRQALLATYSEYNTGDPERGLRNGYVSLVTGATVRAERNLGRPHAGGRTAPSMPARAHRIPTIQSIEFGDPS